MIHDIFPHKLDISFKHVLLDDDSFIIFIEERNILCKLENDIIEYPRLKEINKNIKTEYLFSIDEEKYFLCLENEYAYELINDGYVFLNYRDLQFLNPKHKAYISMLGPSLGLWYINNKYCGKCGKKMERKNDERCLVCKDCNSMIFPRINPCIIVGIINDDKILLTKSALYKRSHYSLVAGFAEAGESIEETLKREVKEEVGLEIENIRFYKSQPWPLSDSLLFGFYADLKGSDEITRQESELSFAKWFKKDEIPDELNLQSLTGELINNFKNNDIK